MKLNLRCLQLLVTILLIIASVPVTSAAEPKVLNIGWTGGSSWTSLPDRVASERGFYDKEGLRVRYIQFQGTNLMLSALLASELDYVTILPFIAGAVLAVTPYKGKSGSVVLINPVQPYQVHVELFALAGIVEHLGLMECP